MGAEPKVHDDDEIIHTITEFFSSGLEESWNGKKYGQLWDWW